MEIHMNTCLITYLCPNKLLLYRNIWGVHCYGDNCSGNYQVFLFQLEKGQLVLWLSPRLVHTYASQGPAEPRWYAGLAPVAKANQLQKPKPNYGVMCVVHKHPATSASPNQIAAYSQPTWKWLLAYGGNVNSGFRNFTWILPDLSPHTHVWLFSMWSGACQTQDCHRVVSSFVWGLSAPHWAWHEGWG